MTIKTIRPPVRLTYKPAQFECYKTGCRAVLEAMPKDGRYTDDQREGEAYVFVCPHCQSDIWVSASQFVAKEE